MSILQELTVTKNGFNPQSRHHQAFDNLKVALTKEPLFTSIIDPAGHYYLFCDAASGTKASFSAVLTQVIKEKEEEYPPYLNLCDPLHDYIFRNELHYRPLPLYRSNERICKSKVDRKIYDPIFVPSYYEKVNLGYAKADLCRTWFISLQSIYYENNCKLLNEIEIRQGIVKLCKKGLAMHKLKTYSFGGHHTNTMDYLSKFQKGEANIDNFLFMLELLAEEIKRTIIVIVLRENEKVTTEVFNPNDKPEIILAAYKLNNNYLFYPLKRVDHDTLKVNDFRNRIQIVAFFSRTVPQTTSVLDIAQVEAIGILWTLEKFKQYVKMAKLTIITDNLVFFSILSRKVLDCNTLMARYALKILVSFPLARIRHILTSHNLADFLTREHKVDKNTLLRLPLHAFKIDNALTRQLNGKESYSLLEFKDFCDKNQKFLLVDTDVVGKQKLSIKDPSAPKSNLTVNALTKENSSPMVTQDFISYLPPAYSETFTHSTPFFSINSTPPPSGFEINALTRSQTRKGAETQTPKPLAPPPKTIEDTTNRQSNKSAPVTKQDVIDKNQNNNRGDRTINPTPQQDTFNEDNNQSPINQIKTGTLPDQDYLAPESFYDDLETAENQLEDAIYPPIESDQHQKKQKLPNPWRIHQAIAKLLFSRTRREILIKDQKIEFKEIIAKCLQSKDFTIPHKGGKFQLQEMLLMFLTESGEEKVVLPPSLFGFVISCYHLLSTHDGVKKMTHTLSHYYIPNLNNLLTPYLSSCYACLVTNKSKSSKIGHMPILRPGLVVHIDLIESLNPNKGYKHILVCVDAFSKYVLAHPIKAKTTAQILPFIVNSVFQLFNLKVLVSDGAGLFTSHIFRKAMSDLGIKHTPVSSHHPAANGKAEVFVGLIKSKLRKLLAFDTTEDWLSILPLVIKSLNTSKLADYNLSPLEILYGPGDENSKHIFFTPDLKTDIPPIALPQDKQKEIAKIIKDYKNTINNKIVKRKERLNKNLSLPDVKRGSYVIAKEYAIIPGINSTLHPKYRNEVFFVDKVKSRSVVATSLTTYQQKLIAFDNIKIINLKNHRSLNVPNIIRKLLLQDSDQLNYKEKLKLAKISNSRILPEPTIEILEHDISDEEDILEDIETENTKKVTFNLEA
jgi:hypothetical protein